jgi:phage N-6-adenine-methyltransferase
VNCTMSQLLSQIEAMEPWGAQVDKSTTKLMFSSKSNDWATPQSFFDKLNGVFGPFTLDAAASSDNYKVANHYTEADNSLSQDWSGNRVFLNPPYGRNLKDWVKKGV